MCITSTSRSSTSTIHVSLTQNPSRSLHCPDSLGSGIFEQRWQHRNSSNSIIKTNNKWIIKKIIRYLFASLWHFALWTYFINSPLCISLLIYICHLVFTLNFSNLLNLICRANSTFPYSYYSTLTMWLRSLASLFPKYIIQCYRFDTCLLS